jgi:sulfite exporter TauE/SafE
MSPLELAAAFLVGLLGSGHCVAMCGGIAVALDTAASSGSGSRAACRMGYQSGRLAGYAIAGALVGGVGAGLLQLTSSAAALSVARGFQALMMILLGLYLSGLWRAPLRVVENQGARLWRALEPVRRRVLPVRGFSGALRMGLLWGFLPCGLVYSALALALAAGSAGAGALTMLAFGMGTLPAVALTGAAGARLAGFAAGSLVRRGAGAVMVAGGLLLAHGAMFPGHPM